MNIETEFMNIENIFTIQRSYETPRQGGTGPAGTHEHVEGWGLMLLWGDCYAHVMLLLWDGSDETGTNGTDAARFLYKEIESNGLGF